MPRVVDREQRRAELIDAAIAAIAERGLDDVKLIDIANQAGVTTGAIGYYFRDKDELLIATLHSLADRLTSANADIMTMFHGDVGLVLPLTADVRRLWRVWLAYCGVAPSSPRLLVAYREFYSTIEDNLAGHLRRRDIDNPRAIAGAIVAAADGIGLCATVAPDLWPEERQVATMRTLLDPLLGVHTSTDIGVHT
ncbi:MAG: TetR/AcrR family transcriptional regulator [Actinomycetota bacterium]